MDKSGVRVGCSTGEEIAVPMKVTDLYISSLENQKSVIVFLKPSMQMVKHHLLRLLYVLVLKLWIPGFMIG